VILASIFSTDYPERPRYPTSAFGAGFSGFDRIDERGWDRAGYTITKDHSQDDWELRSSYQIAYFMALARIFKVSSYLLLAYLLIYLSHTQIPASRLIAYDPCYSIVDVVLLASLGIRALMSKDPDVRASQSVQVGVITDEPTPSAKHSKNSPSPRYSMPLVPSRSSSPTPSSAQTPSRTSSFSAGMRRGAAKEPRISVERHFS
jgi:hypothetical protein